MALRDGDTFVFNLEVLKRSRKPTRPGDIFVLKPLGHPYYFGRVIRTDAKMFSVDNIILCYIYSVSSADELRIPQLDRRRLLVPPILTGPGAWAWGFFKTVAHKELQPEEILSQHCFRQVLSKKYFDADGVQLPGPIEPVGTFGMATARGIDEEVSRALRIPRQTSADGIVKADAALPRQDEPASDDSEQSVVIHLKPWPEGRKNFPLDVMEVEDRLIEAVQATDVGEYDGHGIGSDEIEFFLYGPNAERLFSAIEPALRRWRLEGYVVKRFGPPGSREVRAEL